MILMTSGRFIEWLLSSISSMFRSRFRFMVFNAPFNNISVVSCLSVLLVEETGVPRTNWHGQTLLRNVVSSTPRHGRIRTHNFSGDRHFCTGSCKSNYNTITPWRLPEIYAICSLYHKDIPSFSFSTVFCIISPSNE